LSPIIKNIYFLCEDIDDDEEEDEDVEVDDDSE
jgi:hypothetical protein